MTTYLTIPTGAAPRPWLLRADARALPLPDDSVDLIVTSPPYFRLRTYTDQGQPVPGQLGAEATPGEYLDGLIACTREMIRVLKPAGSLWINLGDRYSGYHRNAAQGRSLSGERGPALVPDGGDPHQYGVPAKSLMGLPWRYALRCIDELGLILRAEVIWAKTAGMPESVTDRVRRSHEQWFHFVRQPRYYSAVDRIRQPHATTSLARARRASHTRDEFSVGVPHTLDPTQFVHPRGALPGSVWTIGPQPLILPAHLGVRHHAAFPPEWPRRLILGWSPAEVCIACGQGRGPVPVRRGLDLSRPQARRAHDLARQAGLTDEHLAAFRAAGASDSGRGQATQSGADRDHVRTQRLAERARGALSGPAREYLLQRPTEFTERCGCPTPTAPTTPGVVADPFGGTGTVALVAAAHGRHGISVDVSADYCRLATWRVHNPSQKLLAQSGVRAARGEHPRVARSADRRRVA